MTSNDSSPNNKFREQLEEQFKPELQKNIDTARQRIRNLVVEEDVLEADYFPNARSIVDELDLYNECDHKWIQEEIDTAIRLRDTQDTSSAIYTEGDEVTEEPPIPWIWEDWIAEGGFHTVVAFQKVGKTSFCLSLFRELVKRTGVYLNSSISIDERYRFVIVGADMSATVWKTMAQSAGLFDFGSKSEKRKPHWHKSIFQVRPREAMDGLKEDSLKTYQDVARQAIGKGYKPIFLFDCYSAFMDNDGSKLSESNDTYYTPLRHLANAMSKVAQETGTPVTSILLHHASLSSSGRGAASAGAGSQKFSRIPDILIKMEKDEAQEHILMSSDGRLAPKKQKVIVQTRSCQYISEGDPDEFKNQLEANREIDKLGAESPYAFCFDHVSHRTANGVGSTLEDIQELRATANRGKPWGQRTIHRFMTYLEKRKLVYQEGTKAIVGQPGRPATVWWSFERPKSGGFGGSEGFRRGFGGVSAGGKTQSETDFGVFGGIDTHKEAQEPEKEQWHLVYEPGEMVCFNGEPWYIVVESDTKTGLHKVQQNDDGVVRTGCRRGIELTQMRLNEKGEAPL